MALSLHECPLKGWTQEAGVPDNQGSGAEGAGGGGGCGQREVASGVELGGVDGPGEACPKVPRKHLRQAPALCITRKALGLLGRLVYSSGLNVFCQFGFLSPLTKFSQDSHFYTNLNPHVAVSV